MPKGATLAGAVEALLRGRDEAHAEIAGLRRELHRWQHGEEIEGDYACQPALDAQVEIDQLRAAARALAAENVRALVAQQSEIVRWRAEADVLSGRACIEAVAFGRGPCGACANCYRAEIERLRAAGDALQNAALTACIRTVNEVPADGLEAAADEWDAARGPR